MNLTYNHTRIACYLNFFGAAVSMTLLGLLLTTLQDEFALDMGAVASLLGLMSTFMIIAIPISTAFAGKFGYRITAVLMQICYFGGIAGLGVFPDFFPTPNMGLSVAVILYTLGTALSEAVTNAIIESLPSKNKDAELSLLHSVYSWACLIVIVGTTAYFGFVSRGNWRLLTFLFALVPLVNLFLFLKTPLMPMVAEGERTPLGKVFFSRMFILILVFIFCDGAVELCMPQWASMFAESALKVPKTMGDLLGPGLFTLGMGISRLFYGFKGGNLKIEKALVLCSLGCFVSYMIVVFAPIPMLSLVGCGLLGLCVGIVAPGCFAIGAKAFPKAGVYVFGSISSFMYIGVAISTKMIGSVTTYVENNQPAIAQSMIPAADAFDLGIRSSFFIVGLLALVMAAVAWMLGRNVNSQNVE